ncbi:unnamed protein product [Rangifer tarandus platyrhynchus]|uniref:Uncharacterized protein n=1 Tax=Rangifer tarandus platyrhynchus TaxID=3082113 RepID=A0AC59Y1T7_RANTA
MVTQLRCPRRPGGAIGRPELYCDEPPAPAPATKDAPRAPAGKAAALFPLTPALPSPPRPLGAGAQTERPQVASLASALAGT